MFGETTHISVAAPVNRVFAYLADPTHLPQWMWGDSMNATFSHFSGQEVGTGYTCAIRAERLGRTLHNVLTVTDYVRDQSIALELETSFWGSPGSAANHISFECIPRYDETDLTMHFDSKPASLITGVFYLVFWPVLKPILSWQIGEVLPRIKKQIESGSC